jgi:hypothetical protein
MMMFQNAVKVKDPVVILPSIHLGKKDYPTEKLTGTFRLVRSVTAREHAAILLIDMHVHRFAPASGRDAKAVSGGTGNGIIISEQAYDSFRQ